MAASPDSPAFPDRVRVLEVTTLPVLLFFKRFELTQPARLLRSDPPSLRFNNLRVFEDSKSDLHLRLLALLGDGLC
jgi:hypothetical protein